MLKRRTFLKYGLIGGFGLGTLAGLGSHMLDTTSDFELRRTIFELEFLPADFENYRIGFISDIHHGIHFPREWLEKCLSLLAAESPDLVLLGGDYLWIPDNFTGKLLDFVRNSKLASVKKEQLAQAIFSDLTDSLSVLKPTDGIYAVYGNHDRWIAPDICAQEFARSKISLLINQKVRIQRGSSYFELFGSDDYWTGIPELKLLGRVPVKDRVLRIGLSHNPDLLAYISSRADLQLDLGLAGHTHGGQILFPVIGALKDNIYDTRLFEGRVKLGEMQCYTTRGIGVVEVPYRFNCRPEVSLLELRRA